MTHDAIARQLIDDVRRRAEPLGYVLEETEEGFHLERNLADTSWWGPAMKAGVKTLVGHQVTLDSRARRLTILDESREVSWKVGASPEPRWQGSATFMQGRINAVGRRRSYGIREDGTYGRIEDYSFDTVAGRATIRDAAREQGWRESQPWQVRVAMVFAVVAGVGAVLTAVILVTAALMGKF